jgi:hypothetical protein
MGGGDMSIDDVIQFCLDTNWSLRELKGDILNTTETEYAQRRIESRYFDAITLESIHKLLS